MHTNTLLIVDDDEIILEVLEVMLTKLGYNVLCANNGLEALKQVQENKNILCVVTDLMMPVMNGCELLKEMKARNYRMPVILVSGYLGNFVEPENFDFYLSKPYNFSQIRDALDITLAHHYGHLVTTTRRANV